MPEPSLDARIAFLSMPSSYPDRTMDVEVIETHMSWVFLTDRYAYKMKKPVAYDYLDFSALDARRFYCEEEFRLNRRLAASVYLGVLPMTMDAACELEFAGEGSVVEWLVLMRRLPEEQSLAHCLQNHRILPRSIDRLGEMLANFYLHCPHEKITPEHYRTSFVLNMDAIMQELAAPEHELPTDALADIDGAMCAFLQQHPALFDERVCAGRIVEGHGDLRAEHVYLEADPVVVDCLEFSKDLRTVDAVFDLAFLALECERLGAPRIGEHLLDLYTEIADDHPPEELIHYYQTYHACSRARIALWHLKEVQYRDSPKWLIQAKEWLQLARWHAALLPVK